jgi:hypothetical protein
MFLDHHRLAQHHLVQQLHLQQRHKDLIAQIQEDIRVVHKIQPTKKNGTITSSGGRNKIQHGKPKIHFHLNQKVEEPDQHEDRVEVTTPANPADRFAKEKKKTGINSPSFLFDK